MRCFIEAVRRGAARLEREVTDLYGQAPNFRIVYADSDITVAISPLTSREPVSCSRSGLQPAFGASLGSVRKPNKGSGIGYLRGKLIRGDPSRRHRSWLQSGAGHGESVVGRSTSQSAMVPCLRAGVGALREGCSGK